MWHFYSPNVIYGEDALNFIEKIKGTRCFIVTDKVIEKLGFLKILTDKLDKFNKNYTIFTEVVPDPHEEDVMKGKEECIKYGPDLIIALGGGSVMDSAKTIWAMYEYPEYTFDSIDPFNDKLYDFANKAKLIAIPTTSGTGAEATWAVVISRFQDGVWRKAGTTHTSLIPTYAIVDPIFPTRMPPELTVLTGFDALAHSIEAYISMWRNEFGNALGLKAIELIFKYLPIAYKEPENKEARDYMHQAATMSGLAFGNSQCHIGHAMGHSWSGIFHTPHGQSVGLFLRYVVEYCLNAPGETNESIQLYSDLAKKLGWAKWSDEDKQAAFTVLEQIKKLQKEVDFVYKLKDLGISREDFDKNVDKMIGLCFQDPSSVMAPRTPSKDEFEKIYKYAYEGKDIDF
ncbi:MAG: iron-containing alcohol dehydrogenase [Promethearchaeota archaeon]|jgi:alcohol dehydrogenase class IV